MKNGKRNHKKAGFVISAELALISTIMVLGLLVGLVAMRDAILGEMHDTAEAIGELNQEYYFGGTYDLALDTFTEGAELQADYRDAGDGEGYVVLMSPAGETPQP